MSKIDRKGWKKITFGEVCGNVNATVRNPLESGIDRYIGLEHIEPESLHIKRWGNVADGTTFTKGFKPGQVLFGKRRAYQKKAAVATFAGLCSGDILVLEPNEKLIDKRLFPFLVASEGFFDYAVKTSAGSLSPRTKFQDLANYEFLLPPKDQQARIAELLWAADDVVQKYERVKEMVASAFKSFVKRALREPLQKSNKYKEVQIPSEYQTKRVLAKIPKEWQVATLRDLILDVQNGFAEGQRESSNKGIIQLRMNNVTREGTINLDDVIRVPIKNGFERYKVRVNDVLFTNTNSEELVGKSVIFEDVPFELVFSNHFTRLRANNDVLKQKFLYLWLKYHFEIGLFQRRCTKWVGQAAVQSENLLSLSMVVPTINEQDAIVEKCSSLETSMLQAEGMIKNSQLIQKQLINQVFG